MKKAAAMITALVTVIFSSVSVYAAPENISAKAAVLMEADSRQVVWGKDEDTRLPMASTTKIMTALLTLESGDLDGEFTVDSEAVKVEGSSMGLREGDIVSKRDLCIGMLLPSGNDAANCAAVKVAGSAENFADMMNARAYELGMRSTHFVTPSGLHDDGHYSTPRDMALLTSYALKNPDFAEICGSRSLKLSFGSPPYDRWLVNTNKLLQRYEDCIGVKTGFTDEAGRCLVSAAERNGVTLICVTLNAPDDWNDHIKLLEYGFSAVSRENIGKKTFTLPAVGSDRDTVNLVTEREISLPVIDGKTVAAEYSAEVPPMLYAPMEKGRQAGTLRVMCGGRVMEEIPLVLEESLPYKEGRPYKPNFYERTVEFFKELLFAK